MGLSKEQRTQMILLLCGAVIAVLNQSMLSPVLPTIMADTGVSATTAQWLASIYSLVEAVVIPLSAYLLGRFSTQRLFCGALALFAVGSIVAALAPSFGFILVGRVLQACGTGVVMPMATTLIMLIFPREKRGTAMGLVMLCIGFAPAVGPVVAGLLADMVSWHALFAIMAVLAAIVAAAGVRGMRNFDEFTRTKLDVPSVALCSAGLIALLYGLSSFTSAENVAVPCALIIVGIVLLAFFVSRQLAIPEPMLKVKVLKSRRYRTGAVAVMLMQASLASVMVVVPLYIQNVLGLSATVSGLVMLPGAILGALCGMVAGRLFDRVGVRPLALFGVVVMMAAGIGMCFFGVDSSILLVVFVYTLAFMAMQFISSPLQTWGVNSLDNRVIQHANALSNTLNQVGASFGTALIVSLTALGSVVYPQATGVELVSAGYHIGFIGAAALIACVLVVVVIFARDRATDVLLPLEATENVAVPETGQAAPEDASAGEAGGPAAGVWKVCHVMNLHVAYVRDSETVGAAALVFAETDTSGLPVVDADGAVVGWVADGDLMRYLGRADMGFVNMSLSVARAFKDQDIRETATELLALNVMNIATKKVVSVPADMDLDQACAVLAANKIKKVPVLEDGKLVGALSRRNVIKAVSSLAK